MDNEEILKLRACLAEVETVAAMLTEKYEYHTAEAKVYGERIEECAKIAAEVRAELDVQTRQRGLVMTELSETAFTATAERDPCLHQMRRRWRNGPRRAVQLG